MNITSYVVFRVDEVEYGVPVSVVQSVEQGVAATRVPRTLPTIRGIFEIRGKVAPLLDLRPRLTGKAQGAPECSSDEYVLIIESEGKSSGFVVDAVSDVVGIDESDIHQTPELVGGIRADYIRGVVHRSHGLLILLDLPKLLSSTELEQIRQLTDDAKEGLCH